MFDGSAVAAEVVKTVREYVAKATEPLLAQIADLQAQIKSLPVPKDGKDADPEQVKAMVDAAIAAFPAPKDGKDAEPVDFDAMVKTVVAAIPVPRDGMDVDPLELKALVDAAVAALPKAKDGENGQDAAPIDVDAVVARVQAAVPVPKNGENGKDAEVDYDRIGKAIEEVVAALPKPKDGKDADPIHPDTLELLVVKQVDAAVSKLPVIVKHGENGKDGLSLEDFDLALGEDGRTLILRLIHGETVVEKSVKWPVQIYRGVYKSGAEYAHGDTATWDGSSWHCERDTKAEPGNGPDWKLMVKRGAPGKDGIGKPGEPGLPGRPGKDLTHITPDGSKY